MELDPILSDAVVPRYALESDSEDELNPLQTRQLERKKKEKPSFEILGQFKKRSGLIVASGDAGAYFAKGANLGEQIGSLQVNNREVGLLFGPTYTKALILISEALLLLPMFAMNPYAQFVLDSFAPTNLALLDAYPTSTYVSTDGGFDAQEPPIRFLSTLTDTSNISFQPFETPNMLSSTSASLISFAQLKEINATLLLLPSPTTPPNHADDFKQTGFFTGQQAHFAQSMMTSVFNPLFALAGEPTSTTWALPSTGDTPTFQSTTQKRTILESDRMYI